ncbi:ComEC/Rec2 family competence protein [Sphingobacterium yanglingense]|uniref:Competence protein ComEC n=1 Tax=Sphingobacterium yanglingense TaxID=1437280 RepID=A0A4R6WNY4_9SPHI|nr:ComEC/Rec2 family competence protein [Sphingobacterium yanglingense]TDQ82884.1 competence protein ComEC [Sphingobacterium yanglingense]
MAMVKDNILGLELGKVPMLRPFLFFAIGVCIAYYSSLDFFPFWTFLLIFLFVLQLLAFQRRRLDGGRVLFAVAFYAMWMVLGITLTVRTMPSYQPYHFSNIKGDGFLIVIDDEPQTKGKTLRFPVVVKAVMRDEGKIHTVGKMMVTIGLDSVSRLHVKYGDLLHVPNRSQEIPPPTNPKMFNYKGYLKSKDIWFQCFVPEKLVKKVDTGKGNPILAKALLLRERMMAKFSRYVDDPYAFQLAVALIFGYRSEMDERMVNAFTNTGTVHILSVSGLHVALVFGLLMLLLKWVDYFPNGSHLRSIIIIGMVWGYVVLTGMSPPILRAGIMITFFILSLAVNRQQVTLNTLFASALFIVLFMPKSLFDVGFQLSYLAVLGIVLLHPLLKKLYLPKNRWGRLLVEYTYISIVAQLFTLPVVLYYFGQFPTYFIPANLFIALPSTGIMYLGVVLALCPFASINAYVGMLLQELLHFSVYGLQYLERLPKAVLKGIVWSDIQVILVLLMLLLMVWSWNFKSKRALFIGMVVFVLFSVTSSVAYIRRLEYSGYRIYNVRSDLAIAQIKKGKVMLYCTFDSLTHRDSRFAILPDLERFSPQEEIEYRKLPSMGRQNYTLSIGGKKILILETLLPDTLTGVDIVIWRKNSKNTIEDIRHRFRASPLILIDGSNSDNAIRILQADKTILEEQMYILKNNFAYVWDEE